MCRLYIQNLRELLTVYAEELKKTHQLDRAYSHLLVPGSGGPEGEDEGQAPAWNSET